MGLPDDLNYCVFMQKNSIIITTKCFFMSITYKNNYIRKYKNLLEKRAFFGVKLLTIKNS